ncbi:MAG: hypothetical protein CVV10_04890 [Gammaproteobacteria bacterium HGW-Gammaproteobacteria-14]|nr:MAG: hypothetical protein CVV10_04890 [Gammaproteobacteria bacterium HGW-Gammaproteobacteria-14]
MIGKIIASLFLLALPLMATADLVIVTGSNSSITSLSENEIRQLFSGQLRSVSGQRVQPLDLPGSDRNREQFYRKLMGRSPDQMRAYWTRLIFTGQGQPPREVSSALELTTLVASSPEYIGYLPASEVNERVRVIYRLN